MVKHSVPLLMYGWLNSLLRRIITLWECMEVSTLCCFSLRVIRLSEAHQLLLGFVDIWNHSCLTFYAIVLLTEVRCVIDGICCSPPAIERLSGGLFQEVIVSNTIPVAEENTFPQLTVLSVANLLGETIWRVHDDCSVSSIFLWYGQSLSTPGAADMRHEPSILYQTQGFGVYTRIAFLTPYTEETLYCLPACELVLFIIAVPFSLKSWLI